ncbi:MAG: O-antigen export protein [Parcubacteria bacterium C7867-004]|nr:MAG: O-antigen export protein [Parcubacteria bacterium C7867-004]
MPPKRQPFRERLQDLLRPLERYTKTDMSYLTRGGFWLTLDEAVGAIAALLLSIAFAQFLPKEVYGTYRFLLALFWVLTAFTMTGLPSAISRAVARGKEGAFRSSFGYSIRFALPLSVLALGTSGYYFIQGNVELGYGLLIIAMLGPLMQAAYLWSAYFNGKKKFRSVAFCGIVFSIVPALALLATMFVSKEPLTLLFSYLASTVLTGLLISVFILVRERPNREPDPEYKNLGWHFSAMNLLSTIAQQVDKIVVFHYLGAVQLAVYALATALPEQVKNVFGSVSTLAFPKFVERPFREIQKTFWYRFWGFTGLLTIVAIAYAIIAPFAFSILFPQYQEAVLYSQIFALALIPTGNTLAVTLLQAHKAKRELYIFNVLSPVFQILALIVLTSLFGLLGTVIARITGRAWSFVLAGILVTTYGWRESRMLASAE